MFTIIYRRLQKYSFWLKLLGLVLSISGLAALIYFTTPALLNILVAALLFWLALFILLSFFMNPKLSLLVAIAFGFLAFLKAVDLLTPLNIALLFAFLVLLLFYFRNPKEAKPTTDTPPPHRKEVLFPKGWPFRVAKKKRGEYNQENDNK